MDKKYVLEDYGLEDDQSLEEFIDILKDKAGAIPYRYRDAARVRLYQGSVDVHLDVYYYCPSKVDIEEAKILLTKEGYLVEKSNV